MPSGLTGRRSGYRPHKARRTRHLLKGTSMKILLIILVVVAILAVLSMVMRRRP